MRRININEQHTLLLEMAKAFHQVCTDHNIPYFMLGGTMLGAVRHKGFIPWDDDMDFGIPRHHYDDFLTFCSRELPKPYRMLTHNNSDYAVLGIGKINNDNTIMPEICAVKTDEQIGINIDIFPLDYTDSATSILTTNWLVRKGFKLQKLLFMDTGFRPWYKKVLAIVAKNLIKVKKNAIPNYIHRHMLKRKCNIEMVANLYGAWAMKEVVPKDYFGTPVLYDFEDTQFFGVSNADAYLKQLYNNYMQLPPENKRHIHSTDAYLRD